jgi:hypothetical protein
MNREFFKRPDAILSALGRSLALPLVLLAAGLLPGVSNAAITNI